MAAIIDQHKAEIDALCDKHQITYLGLFGSYAREEETKESDIDLLVEFGEIKSLFEHAHIRNAFYDVFGRNVDLISKNGIKPRLKPYIMDDLQTIYEAKK